MDGGKIRENQLCPPQLLIFDLATDKLVKRVAVPLDIAHNKKDIGLLASISVDAPNCKNVMNNTMVSFCFKCYICVIFKLRYHIYFSVCATYYVIDTSYSELN